MINIKEPHVSSVEHKILHGLKSHPLTHLLNPWHEERIVRPRKQKLLPNAFNLHVLTAICMRDEPGDNAEDDVANHCCGLREADSQQLEVETKSLHNEHSTAWSVDSDVYCLHSQRATGALTTPKTFLLPPSPPRRRTSFRTGNSSLFLNEACGSNLGYPDWNVGGLPHSNGPLIISGLPRAAFKRVRQNGGGGGFKYTMV